MTATAFVPLKFEPGDAFQIDWSEEGLVVGGIYCQECCSMPTPARSLPLAGCRAVASPTT